MGLPPIAAQASSAHNALHSLLNPRGRGPAFGRPGEELQGKALPARESGGAFQFSLSLDVQRFQAAYRMEDSVNGRLVEGFASYESFSLEISGTFSGENIEEAKEKFQSLLDEGLEELQSFFSPENTAQRITDFALSRFVAHPLAGEASEGDRQGYVDFILPFIQQGYDDARSILGDLDEEISNPLEETISIVRQRMSDFVSGPSDEEVAEEADAGGAVE